MGGMGLILCFFAWWGASCTAAMLQAAGAKSSSLRLRLREVAGSGAKQSCRALEVERKLALLWRSCTQVRHAGYCAGRPKAKVAPRFRATLLLSITDKPRALNYRPHYSRRTHCIQATASSVR